MSEEKKEIEKQAAEAMRGLFHEFRYDIDELTLPILMDMAAFDGVTRLQSTREKPSDFSWWSSGTSRESTSSRNTAAKE